MVGFAGWFALEFLFGPTVLIPKGQDSPLTGQIIGHACNGGVADNPPVLFLFYVISWSLYLDSACCYGYGHGHGVLTERMHITDIIIIPPIYPHHEFATLPHHMARRLASKFPFVELAGLGIDGYPPVLRIERGRGRRTAFS